MSIYIRTRHGYFFEVMDSTGINEAMIDSVIGMTRYGAKKHAVESMSREWGIPAMFCEDCFRTVLRDYEGHYLYMDNVTCWYDVLEYMKAHDEYNPERDDRVNVLNWLHNIVI